MASGGERRIALAAVAGAHGVRGELRLKLFSETAESLALHQTVYVGGAPKRILWARQSGRNAVAKLEGVADRASAESLRGSLVEVDRSALPPLEEGEYYHADLIGVAAVDSEARSLGRVVAVENYGAGDLLEIEDEEGRRWLIPFKPSIADFEDGRIVVDPNFLA